MILKSISYNEFRNKKNYWEVNDVNFSKLNLIVGLNATGKTRLTNVISNLAAILASKKRLNGNWDLTFSNGTKLEYSFKLYINNLKIEYEEIKENDQLLLERKKESGKIFSKKEKRFHDFNPPDDELTLNVRRDTAHYPFLEVFIEWAKQLKGYAFSGVLKDQITVPNKPEGYLESLTTVPYILKDASGDAKLIKNILYEMTQIGYPITKISTKALELQPNLQNIFHVILKESDLKCETNQASMSNGMFRALCLIVLLEYLLKKRKTGTILIDDLGEGLDFERSSKLTNLIFDKMQNTNFQLIVTSNNRFLINNVDMKNINYLTRKGHIVTSLNYHNNKDVFDKFIMTGLNNFDFLNPDLSHLKN